MKAKARFVRVLIAVSWATALVPLSYLACLYAFVFRNRLLTEHWPSAVEQASLTPGFDLHEDITYLLGLTTLGSILVVLALAASCAWNRVDGRDASRVLLPVAGSFGLALLLVLSAPGRFHRWFYAQMDERAKQHVFREWSRSQHERN